MKKFSHDRKAISKRKKFCSNLIIYATFIAISTFFIEIINAGLSTLVPQRGKFLFKKGAIYINAESQQFSFYHTAVRELFFFPYLLFSLPILYVQHACTSGVTLKRFSDHGKSGCVSLNELKAIFGIACFYILFNLHSHFSLTNGFKIILESLL